MSNFRMVVLSDTHLQQYDMKIPDGDILIHAGDFSMRADIKDTFKFFEWMRDQPHKYKLIVPGNHDVYCAENMSQCKMLAYPMIFDDAGVYDIGSYRFLLYSWTPAPHSQSRWKFHPEYGDDEFFRRFWEFAPRCDVLVTHGPPKGILDKVNRTYLGEDSNVGEWHMLKYIERNIPIVHVFGHIHEGYGEFSNGPTTFYNASNCNVDYKANNPITIIDI